MRPIAWLNAKRFVGELDSGIDLAVQGIAFSGQKQSPPMPLVYRVDVIAGEWRIVAAAHGNVSELPDFFDWWESWQRVFPGEIHPL